MRENMELLIKKLNKACLIYKKDFLNKDFLVIARKRKNTEIVAKLLEKLEKLVYEE